jgi:hypothetical protein
MAELMAGHLQSFTSYVMTRAQPSLSLSPRLTGSSEDSLKKVGIVRVDGLKMRELSYIQLIENRFTGSLMLRGLSIVVPIKALTMEETD